MERFLETAPGVKIFYRIEKRPGDGPTFVFLHGLGGDSHIFKNMFDDLGAHGSSVLALDLRGHGLSSRPRRLRDYTVEAFASDLEAILREEKIRRVILVGHCIGGYVAAEFATRHPRATAALCLISVPQIPIFFRILGQSFFALLPWRFVARFLGERLPYVHIEHERYNNLVDLHPRRLAVNIRHTTLLSYVYTLKHVLVYRLAARLAALKLPILLVVAENDKVVPPGNTKLLWPFLREGSWEALPRLDHLSVIVESQAAAHSILAFADTIFPKLRQRARRKVLHIRAKPRARARG